MEVRHWISFILCLSIAQRTQALGKTNFECPDGFHLSNFGAFYDKTTSERMYRFGCSALGKYEITDEKCELSRPALTADGDMYLTCEDWQYTTGISILEDMRNQIWTLLCCQSPQVTIKQNRCVTTQFLNDFQQNLDFHSHRRVVRKWQSIYNETQRDRRWWLQVCSTDISVSKSKTALERHRFTRSAGDLFGRRTRLHSAHPLPLLPSPHVRVSQLVSFSDQKGVHFEPDLRVVPNIIQSTSARPWTQPKTTKIYKKTPADADEYYDYYATDEEKAIQEHDNSLFGGLQNLLQNVQDGLSFAEVALPLEPEKTKEIVKKPTFSLNVDQQPQVVKQQTNGAIQNMLQFLGLCNGHN